MKRLFTIVAVLFCIAPVFAEVTFSGGDINPASDVLFSVSADIPGSSTYSTLFRKSLATGAVEQLTFFPESLESLDSGSVVQIRNRFGTARFNTGSGKFVWIEDRKPFVSGGSVSPGMLADVATSPDGRYLVLIEPVTPARGKMILFDTVRDVRYVLANSVERGSVPVSWSPDAAVFVYEVAGTLHFARPESFFSVTVVPDKFRVLGPGRISSVSWYAPSRFLFVSGTDVYRIQASELFTRSLYSPLLGYGELAGKLPFSFDPSGDTFSASPDGTALLYSRGSRSVHFCPLNGDDYVSVTNPALLPWVLLPGNTGVITLFWTPGNTPVVVACSLQDGRRVLKAWKMSTVSGNRIFVPLAVPEQATRTVVSRTGDSIAFISPLSVQVFDSETWEERGVYRDQPVVSVVWGGPAQLYVGGTDSVVLWNYSNGAVSPLIASSVRTFGWDETGTRVLAETSREVLAEYSGAMRWNVSSASRIRPASTANRSWRLYLDSGKGTYANMLYVRSTGTPGGTWPLVREPAPLREPVAASDAGGSRGNSPGVFSHGNRTGKREVALVFDAMDTLEGLPLILDALERYGIRTTFFINGEFIRRNPAAVNEIVKAGHQCASLFYTTWNLSGPQYRIDEDFIARGLSRNEDDFFNATGQELSLLWHAPFYVLSPDILSAGEKAGYRYIAPDIMVPDWVSAEQDYHAPGLYKSAADIVEDIVRTVRPGSIIPVRIGTSGGYRDSYLFEKVDLLLNALIESGYSLVTVDILVQNDTR